MFVVILAVTLNVFFNQAKSPEKLFIFIRTKTYKNAKLHYRTIRKNRQGLGLSKQFLLFFADLPPASDCMTVLPF